MAFRNLMLTTSGMILYAKAQQGKLLHLSRVAVGDGLLTGGDSMVNRNGLKSERAAFLIDYVHIAASNSAAEILTTMRNDDLGEGFYFRELGIFAVDPDSGEEQLYLYDNAGQDGEYIPAASENIKVVERLKMIVRLENTPNVSFTASGNPLYLTVEDIDDNAQSPGSLWSSLKISQMIEKMQSSLSGEPGQLVGFDRNGKPVPLWVIRDESKSIDTVWSSLKVSQAIDAKQDCLSGAQDQFVGFNKDGKPEPQYGVGRSMTGKTVKPTSGKTVVASSGAEIFNDYQERSYNGNGQVNRGNVASGFCARSEGSGTTASGRCAHAEGEKSIASGDFASHAEGFQTEATGGYGAHSEGTSTKATGNNAHAEGSATTASGICAHTEGSTTIASGNNAHAEGGATTARGESSHAGGAATIAAAYAQTAIGAYNIESTKETDKLIVGKGVYGARANCFRVTHAGVYASGSHNSSGADYAELFEWLDGNPDKEDRTGRFVTLDGKYIRLATSSDDYILGIVSGNPSVVGDVYDDQWAGMFVSDIYGRPVYEWRDFPAETMEVPDENGRIRTIEIIPVRKRLVQKLDPNYDPSQTYIPRTQRQEWDAVGLLGKLVVLDDGTCQPNGWATVGEGGIATASKERTKFRIMERLDESHVRVMVL